MCSFELAQLNKTHRQSVWKKMGVPFAVVALAARSALCSFSLVADSSHLGFAASLMKLLEPSRPAIRRYEAVKLGIWGKLAFLPYILDNFQIF